MNDFTKDELEHLHEMIGSISIAGHPIDDEALESKIQSMIDGYCEHENIVSYNGAECVYWCMDCSVVKGAI